MVRRMAFEVAARRFRAFLPGFLLLILGSQFPVLRAQAPAFNVANLNGVRYVNAYAGGNLGAKLAACLADLPAYPSGGICDARGLDGPQTISSNPFTAVVGRATILFGNATITTVPLVLPDTQGMIIRGMGVDATKFVASAENSIIFQGPQGVDTICDGCYLGSFAVQAHASGSTGPAIDTSGFRGSTFEDIRYLSNGSGNFNSLFHFSASPNLDYNNRVIHPIVIDQSGPSTVFLFDNGGTSNPAYNAQNHFIYDVWIYDNTGVSTIFDLRRSTQVVIRGGNIEGNTGAVIVIPGTLTTLEDIWAENNASTPIVPDSGSDGASQGVVLRDNYFATPFTVTIPAWASDWMIVGNQPNDNLSVVDNGTNNFIQYGATMAAVYAGPTVSGFSSDSQDYISGSANAIGLLNSTSKRAALMGINETNSGAQSNIFGGYFVSSSSADGASSHALEADGYGSAASGSMGSVTGIDSYAGWSGAGTVDTLASLHAYAPSKSAGTVTKAYGLLVDDVAGVGSSNYAIYTGAGRVKLGDTLTIDGNVGIGTTEISSGQKLEVNGGVALNTTAAKPSCSATTRGTFWVTQGDTGVKDSVEVCAKDTGDAYAWRTIY
jgi:hypothetical protein